MRQKADKQILLDGTVEFNEELPVEENTANRLYYESSEFKDELANLSMAEIDRRRKRAEKALKTMIYKNILRRMEILELVKDHRAALRLLTWLLGLSQELHNPTLPGLSTVKSIEQCSELMTPSAQFPLTPYTAGPGYAHGHAAPG